MMMRVFILFFLTSLGYAQGFADSVKIYLDTNKNFGLSVYGYYINGTTGNARYDLDRKFYIGKSKPVLLMVGADCLRKMDTLYLDGIAMPFSLMDSVADVDSSIKDPGKVFRVKKHPEYLVIYLTSVKTDLRVSGRSSGNSDRYWECLYSTMDVGPHIRTDHPGTLDGYDINGKPIYLHRELWSEYWMSYQLEPGWMVDSIYIRNYSERFKVNLNPEYWADQDPFWQGKYPINIEPYKVRNRLNGYVIDGAFNMGALKYGDTLVVRAKPKNYNRLDVLTHDLDAEYALMELGATYKDYWDYHYTFNMNEFPLPVQLHWGKQGGALELSSLAANSYDSSNHVRHNAVEVGLADTLKQLRIGWFDTLLIKYSAKNKYWSEPVDFGTNRGYDRSGYPGVRYDDNRCLVAAYLGSKLLKRWDLPKSGACPIDTAWVNLEPTVLQADAQLSFVTKSTKPTLGTGGWNPYLGDSLVSTYKKRYGAGYWTFYYIQKDSIWFPRNWDSAGGMERYYTRYPYPFAQAWDTTLDGGGFDFDTPSREPYNDSIAWKFYPGPNRTLQRTGLARQCWDWSDPLNSLVSDTIWGPAVDSVIGRFDSATLQLSVSGFGTVDYGRCSNLNVVFDVQGPKVEAVLNPRETGLWAVRSDGSHVSISWSESYAVQWLDVRGRTLRSTAFGSGERSFEIPSGMSYLRIVGKNGQSGVYPWFGRW